MMTITTEQAAQFLYREARLMDQSRYDDWLSLWSTDATYWVPCNEPDADPERHVSLIYLDRKGIEGRIIRLKSGTGYAQEPRSKMSRIVGNIEVDADGRDGGAAVVHSVFNLTELRRHEQRTFSGRVEHTLVPDADGWKIRRKKVVLVNLDEPIANLTFLV